MEFSSVVNNCNAAFRTGHAGEENASIAVEKDLSSHAPVFASERRDSVRTALIQLIACTLGDSIDGFNRSSLEACNASDFITYSKRGAFESISATKTAVTTKGSPPLRRVMILDRETSEKRLSYRSATAHNKLHLQPLAWQLRYSWVLLRKSYSTEATKVRIDRRECAAMPYIQKPFSHDVPKQQEVWQSEP